MPNLARVRTSWAGTAVTGGGVSTFYFAEAHSGFVADVTAMWTAMVLRLVTGMVLTTENTGDLIDIATGEISGSWTDGTTSNVATTGTGVYAAGVGARIRWATSGITNGRRVRGSTFIVPLTSGDYDSNGTIGGAALTAIGNGAGALFTGSEGNLRIYTRPVAGRAGAAHPVVGYTTPDKVSWLRSRRT